VFIQWLVDGKTVIFVTIDPTSRGLLMVVKMVPIQAANHDPYIKHHALDMRVRKQPTVILLHFGKPQFNLKQLFLPPEHDKHSQLHRKRFKKYRHDPHEHMKPTTEPKTKFQPPPIHLLDDPKVPEQSINNDIIGSSDNELPSTKFFQMMADDIANPDLTPPQSQAQDDNNSRLTPKSKRKYNKKAKVHTTVEYFVQQLPTMSYTTMEINQFHRAVGHVNDKFLHTTAKHYGIHLT
jgi:hypothetical protein